MIRTYLSLIPLSVAVASATWGQGTVPAGPPDSAYVGRVLATELQAAQDQSHPMRYRLRKSSPRLTTTKDLIETQDGSVAYLVSVNGRPLTPSESQKEESRLNGLLADPGKQRHRKQTQEQDMSRAMDVLRVLPKAFVYQYAGPIRTTSGAAERFTFSPNPQFNPPDLETQVLTALNGEIWIDSSHLRVVHLEGRLTQDVDFGWGILGRLYKGGWIGMDQAEVTPGQWRIVHFRMAMTGRVVFRTRAFETIEDTTQYAAVPTGISYRQGIQMLRSMHPSSPIASR